MSEKEKEMKHTYENYEDDGEVLKVSLVDFLLSKKIEEQEELVMVYNKHLQKYNDSLKNQAQRERFKQNKRKGRKSSIN